MVDGNGDCRNRAIITSRQSLYWLKPRTRSHGQSSDCNDPCATERCRFRCIGAAGRSSVARSRRRSAIVTAAPVAVITIGQTRYPARRKDLPPARAGPAGHASRLVIPRSYRGDGGCPPLVLIRVQRHRREMMVVHRRTLAARQGEIAELRLVGQSMLVRYRDRGKPSPGHRHDRHRSAAGQLQHAGVR